jgi:hypothetical protein
VGVLSCAWITHSADETAERLFRGALSRFDRRLRTNQSVVSSGSTKKFTQICLRACTVGRDKDLILQICHLFGGCEIFVAASPLMAYALHGARTYGLLYRQFLGVSSGQAL